MKYQKIINFLDNTSNQPSKCRTKGWVETKDDARGTYNTNIQIKLKNSMLKSGLCDYSDLYILVSGTITVAEVAAVGGNNNVQVIFKIVLHLMIA